MGAEGRNGYGYLQKSQRNGHAERHVAGGFYQSGRAGVLSGDPGDLQGQCLPQLWRFLGLSVGTIGECKARVAQYKHFLLFSIKYEIENSFDLEGMQHAMISFKESVDGFDEKLKEMLPDYLLLSNEGCGRCRKCTYPDSPCRFPERLHHSIEGYGFNVYELSKVANIKYNNGANTVTFFGGLLFGRAGQ